jgi:hypothetical protein
MNASKVSPMGFRIDRRIIVHPAIDQQHFHIRPTVLML